MTWDLSDFDLNNKKFSTSSLTIQKIEWEDRNWDKVLKITLAEDINYGNNILNTMHFLRFPEDSNGKYLSDAEAFFYFSNKLFIIFGKKSSS